MSSTNFKRRHVKAPQEKQESKYQEPEAMGCEFQVSKSIQKYANFLYLFETFGNLKSKNILNNFCQTMAKMTSSHESLKCRLKKEQHIPYAAIW